MKIKKPFFIHQFLFALYPILAIYSHNINEATFTQTLTPTIYTLTLTAIVFLVNSIIFKNFQKAGIITTLFLLLFFSYGHIFNMLLKQGWVQGWVLLYRQLTYIFEFIVFCLIFLSVSYFIFKKDKKMSNLTIFLNIVSIVLILILLANITAYKAKIWIGERNTNKILNSKKESLLINENKKKSNQFEILPDIYYIILDAYGSSSVLQEFYNFNNHEFIDYLSGKEFYIASKSVSNYPETYLSLTSSLNMEYLPTSNNADKRKYYAKLQDNMVLTFLKAQGYTYVHLGSSYEVTRVSKHADININFGLSEFERILINSTILRPFLALFDLDISERKEHWKRILYKLDKLDQISKIKDPTFTFAHFIIPHEPSVFKKNGEFLRNLERYKTKPKHQYIEQIIFINTQLAKIINKLLLETETLPIIILQADHGPLFTRNEFMHRFTEKMIKKRFGILNAYYLPGVNKSSLYPSITPVNSFRLIFNLYFGTHYDLLPDKVYMQGVKQPHRFIDVTNKIK